MIRISDLNIGAAWSRPAGPATPSRADLQDPSSWFADEAARDARLTCDLSPSARGLTVEQHAARVLSALCGEPDASA